MALRGGELCLCQIIGLLRLSPSTVSKHMAILNQAGLVEARKRGRWVYYQLPHNGAEPCAAQAVAWMTRNLAKNTQMRADEKCLKSLCRLSIAELGACYKRANGMQVKGTAKSNGRRR
jgi:DNA-binding transcriptional ArsR family regulator